MKAVRRSERPAEQIQPDPMLQERRRANPIALGVAAIFALMIVSVVFYGLSRDVEPATVSAGSSEAPASTSGQAPANQVQGAPTGTSGGSR